MMWLKWLPWKFIVRRLALRHGFLDPITVLGYVRRFAQPSEVVEPIELLRAGVVMHARGLMNSRAIQHNLDWVWPFWVERQFDPENSSFVPRAFSLTHINLTHRNWTAVGVPGCEELPVVDPRGLVMPFWDSWSLDGWVIDEEGHRLIPSRRIDVKQWLDCETGWAVVTECDCEGMSLRSTVDVEPRDNGLHLRMRLRGTSERPGWLVVAMRPYNPEGVSFVHRITLERARPRWNVDKKYCVAFSERPEAHALSGYHHGDVGALLPQDTGTDSVKCEVGMATAAALFRLEPDRARELKVTVPLTEQPEQQTPQERRIHQWTAALEGVCNLQLPDELYQRLYEIGVRSMVLHCPDLVFPGPYTYKRFWFRDAAFILHAMLCVGLWDRARRVLDQFSTFQTPFGFFHSQEGEWDSNGEALWILHRYCELTNVRPPSEWFDSIEKGAHWIVRKRLKEGSHRPHDGLFPAGFSAEHLGPIDYYYWDNFWGVAGLRSAGSLMDRVGETGDGQYFAAAADGFMAAIERSLESAHQRLGRAAMPAAPYRRLDSGAVGSLCAGYPLHLWPARDPRVLDTAAFMLQRCMVQGGVFQDMIHSGINPYLTLHLAQVLMRAGEPGSDALVRVVAELASPTGQWPEAIHPLTHGGCMGDGHHVWASAEWVMMMRNSLLLEEGRTETLVIGAGLLKKWLEPGCSCRLGPAPTRWGEVELRIEAFGDRIEVHWKGTWRQESPRIEIRLPGRPAELVDAGSSPFIVSREDLA